MSHANELFDFTKSNFTNTTHKQVYPAVDPTRSELTQAGKAILVSGGGANLGFSIAQAFLRAAAATVVIVGRRSDVIQKAVSQLEHEANVAGSSTRVIGRACDVTDKTQIDALWHELNEDLGIIIDVLIANAAKPGERKTMLESGTDEIWSQLEVNARAPLSLTEKLCSQPGGRQKFIVNVSSASIHYYTHPATAARPGATLSKTTGTLMFQLMAMENAVEELQIISFHPGLLWNEYFESLGLSQDQFDSRELAGAFAVWAATKEAAFLHGRFVWAAWDVDELASGKIRKQIEDDPYFLRTTIAPLKRGAWT